MLPVVAIVGRPNVGKSTLFNRIIGERKSITDDLSGITRDRIYSKAAWLNHEFRLIDTGGIEISDAPFLTEIKAQAEIAIEESDVIIFAVDGREGLLPTDRDVMNMLYASDKPIIVAVNKLESEKHRENLYDFYELGAASVVMISSSHGLGIGNLLDEVLVHLPEEVEDEYEDDFRRICVIGRPNVGKSSLVNTILGNDRLIVSNISGTTTDSIDTQFTKDDTNYVLIDTAGMRKRGRIYENIDKYANLRAFSAIERSDICLVLIDAETGIQAQDKHIAGYALENNKALILVVNKWDTIEKDQYTMNEWEKDIRKEFRFLSYIPIVYVSAKTGARVKSIFPVIDKTYENYDRRVSTSILNEVISEAILLNPPKAHKQKIIKVYYVTQVKTKCPTFVLFVNDTNCIHFSYYRYLENRLRERFDFFGTPLNLVLRNRE
jgi:GTP-binding protein